MTRLQALRMENAELISTLRKIHRLADGALESDELEDEELEDVADDEQDDTDAEDDEE